MLRCKFKCKSKMQDTAGYTIEMVPVTIGSPENDEFFKYTPFGAIQLGIVKEETACQIEVGEEYYIDISEAK